ESDLFRNYHESEWGVPCNGNSKLFELSVLEGAQAELSCITILKKREDYRLAFSNFSAVKSGRYNSRGVERLLANPGIVRNRQKSEATITNARSFLDILQEFGSFSTYFWGFCDGKPIVNHWTSIKEIPATTPLSDRISKDMKERGFRFFGSTICYAHMQATGM